MLQSEERCKNCSQHLLLRQQYCHACGQRTDTHRISWHFLLHEVQHGIFHVDSGILYTLKELFTRPGHTLREYLQGKRRAHFPPLLLVVILGSLCALIQYFFKKEKPKVLDGAVIKGEFPVAKVAGYVDFDGLVTYFRQVFEWFAHHFAFTVLLMLPVAAFAFYLGFRKYRLTYPEWFVLMLFFAGQSLTVYVFFIFLNHFAGNFTTLFYFSSWGLISWTLMQFFNERPRRAILLRTIWSGFLTYLFSLLYLIVAILLISVVGLVLFGYETLLPTLLKSL